MVNQEKNSLSVLFSEEIQGPFVTFLLNTHIARQNTEKAALTLKNFAKHAKERFNKKYPSLSWEPFKEKINLLLSDSSFWRVSAKSLTIILTQENTYVYEQRVEIDDQYYVGNRPYLLGIIKNNQFSYHYYLLALNRDSMKLYHAFNDEVSEIELPKTAPTTIINALGDELTGGDINYSIQGGTGFNGSTKEGIAYHGVNAKDEEVKIDWVNYYQAVDNFFKKDFENPEQLPIRLYTLPENQTLFKKIAKNNYLNTDASYPFSPAQASIKDIQEGVKKINQQLELLETATYNKLLDKKFVDQLVDILPAAEAGRISHFFISTSNFITETNEMSATEFDRRQVLNKATDKVLQAGGEVFVLDQQAAPDEKSLLAILRY
ncbi:baeRF6 domain-containing protein [Enterococcus rivorum]|uniref:Bacterial archaeo-eukaryotic release factor family 6 domain-containing protein n=1 Tax=Enterococcus rivorum TaxID=762845 RepID=A0A1E5KYZ4_9ENTE|nr:hypothetical protein [Enterococcus rivorum]MBP2099547.1 hypothetical protein [Enterococcus rivorum]OEH82909.1 hypothetical protein BCR26_11270 [Enterococcus rivorum]